MKRDDVNQCLRQYRKSVEAYHRLETQLQGLRAGKDGRFGFERRLLTAEAALQALGDGLSFVPEMAVELLEKERIAGILRRHLEARGIAVDYGEPGAPSSPAQAAEDDLEEGFG